MTAIERTAYPRFSAKAQYRKEMLHHRYALNADELQFIKKHSRNPVNQLNLAAQLKIVQNLGYFVDPEEIPGVIIKYLRTCLSIRNPIKSAYAHKEKKSRQRAAIRKYLGLIKWEYKKSLTSSLMSPVRFATMTAFEAAQTLNHPADIINIVIEKMMLQKYELPVFDTLDRLARHVKQAVNSKIFNQIKLELGYRGMIPAFDKLLFTVAGHQRTGYDAIKSLPKSVSPKNFRELIKHHNWLQDLGNMEHIFFRVSKNKIAQFAAQAKSFDASDLRPMSESARYSLIAALLLEAQKNSKDDLVISFCRTIFKMHKQAKELLQKLQDEHADSAQSLADFLMNITLSVEENQASPEQLAESILNQYREQGGTAKIAADCERVSAYNSKNYLPLLCQFFQKKRGILFELLKTLNPQSATQELSLIKAIKVMLSVSQKRSNFITVEHPLDHTFMSENWLKLVFPNLQDKRKIDRRFFEMSVFTHLAYDLRSGDIYIEGANSYADYRKDLLSWDECLPLLEDFCEKANLPNNAKDFTSHLKKELAGKAKQVV